MVAAVKELVPDLLPLVLCAYSLPSSLFLGKMSSSYPREYSRATSRAPALLPDHPQHGAAAAQ